MDNKFNNMLQDFLKNNNVDDIDEANEKLQEFIKMYNNGEIEYKNTPLDDALEILEKAERAKSKGQAIKYAKEAYEKCHDCFDAIILQANLESNPIKRWNLLNDGLEYEKKRLEKEGYFKKDNIGHFYGIFETRPYIRGLCTKVDYLLCDGKMKQAKDLCKEILKLNEHDNLGVRYMLMAIYVYLEDESEMLKLYRKFNENNFEMLFPLFVLYYKLGNDVKAKEYLDKVNKANPHFIKFIKGTMKPEKNVPEGYFSPGDPSEIIMYFTRYRFLLETMPTIHYYILENSKKKK